MSGYEPNAGAQADIEAEIIRSAQMRRRELAETAGRFSNQNYLLVKSEVWKHREQVADLTARLAAVEAALEQATACLDALEIETRCCICGEHMAGPENLPLWRQSHSICSKCLPDVTDRLGLREVTA